MEQAGPLLLWVFGCFGAAMLGAWGLFKLLAAQKVEAVEENKDPPALRSHARVDLKPAVSWQQLDDAAIAMGQSCFEGVLGALNTAGIEFGPPVHEDWGLIAQNGPLQLAFGPMDDGTGWGMFLQRAGHRPAADDAVTRRILGVLDAALRKMPGVTTVGWYKREGGGEPAASPIQS